RVRRRPSLQLQMRGRPVRHQHGRADRRCPCRVLHVGTGRAAFARRPDADAYPHRRESETRKDPRRVSITRIELETEAEIPGIDDATFQRHALDAKQSCPVSKALAGTEIHLKAALL